VGPDAVAPSDALRPAPGRITVGKRVSSPHRTTYVCELFAIDRFVAFASETACA